MATEEASFMQACFDSTLAMAHTAAPEVIPVADLQIETLLNYQFDALILVAPTFAASELTTLSEKIKNTIDAAKKVWIMMF